MGNTTKTPLVSSEISGIWNSYMGENLVMQLLKYFYNRVDDNEIRDILQHSLNLSNERIKILTNLFNEERLPLPEGFSDNDIDVNAPRLFTDALYLQYIIYKARAAIRSYSVILNRITRADIRDYFSKCIEESIDLCNKSAELSLSKGIFIKAPHVEVSKEIQYIKSKSFILDSFGKKRGLLTDEISHIFSITNDTMIRKALLIGFGQVCEDRKISNYISKVIALATKQHNDLTSLLIDEGIPIGSSSDSYVTDSTVSPFSHKFMLSKIFIMYRIKIGSIGMALADIMRSDLKTIYMKHLNENIEYSKDGVDIMIDNKWLEQPPQAINHKNLAKV
ncbi:DUF3231 family protein [Clostridium sp. WILCCON 0269]|uniref:DUF3231 family protein n=1 Tax=Candidatus Clostridium eludens TaxID=3381663 RepID=A0ABW8SDK6_9CLOT